MHRTPQPAIRHVALPFRCPVAKCGMPFASAKAVHEHVRHACEAARARRAVAP